MRLNDAVDAVTGEIFRDGWSRIRGSMQGLHAARQKQLVRAAAGHRAAVFKAIRGGGTHTKSQLASQLDYLTTKSTHIVDSSGFLDGKSKLEAREVKDLTERFAKRWEGGFKPKLGQTTHLLMSFPIGTRGEDVRDIGSDVAERFFQTDEGHFDYIIAVHVGALDLDIGAIKVQSVCDRDVCRAKTSMACIAQSSVSNSSEDFRAGRARWGRDRGDVDVILACRAFSKDVKRLGCRPLTDAIVVVCGEVILRAGWGQRSIASHHQHHLC